MDALKKMNVGKIVYLDGIVVEMFKFDGFSVMNWFWMIFNRCMEIGVVWRIGR